MKGSPPAKSDPMNPTDEDCRVRREDLDELPKIHALLKALNDPMANTARLVGDVRVLSARCIRRARLKAMKRELPSVAYALQVIGNKGTEQELLNVLEDLTVFKAELEG